MEEYKLYFTAEESKKYTIQAPQAHTKLQLIGLPRLVEVMSPNELQQLQIQLDAVLIPWCEKHGIEFTLEMDTPW